MFFLIIITALEAVAIYLLHARLLKSNRLRKEQDEATNEYIEKMRAEIQKEKDLETQLALAKEASVAKSNFLSNMSHEIRTPINAILGMNEIILRDSREEDTLKYSRDIKASGDILLNIINDILDLSKIEAGKTEIINARYDVSSFLNNIVSMMDIQAENKGLKLDLNINPDIPSILNGDENRLQQCVLNLLSNAIKYTEEGSVGLMADYRKVNSNTVALTFKVSDTGIGISSDNLEKIFQPYDRLDEAKVHSIEGTGLGLEIVSRILNMMGSTLRVHSVYGEGSTFYFIISQAVLDWEPIGDFSARYMRLKETKSKYSEPYHAPNANILVVDDTNMNLIVIKGLLKKTQIKIDTADSGREALSMIRKKKYDIIFIDHKMPGLDGIETHDQMMKMDNNPNIDVPCVALTANAVSGARESYLEAGFQDYLSKPVSSDRLEKLIERYIPRDLIIYPGDPGFVSENDVRTVESADMPSLEDDDGLSEFSELKNVNLKAALKNCDTIDILREALKEFYQTIPGRARAIEDYADHMDFRNFTVAVHALKSNARLIGAMRLSDEAATMEQYGNDENAEMIALHTPHLLRMYRNYITSLAPMEKYLRQSDEAEAIPESKFLGALSDMRELIEVFDYDSAQSIMHMVECYKIPQKFEKKWQRIRTLMAEVDLDELLLELNNNEEP